MTTLELYRKHKKGDIGRDRFLYEVRRDGNLPWITNITSYDDAVKILKNKGIIREAQFEPQNIPTDAIVDRVNPYALKREVEKILSKEKELTNDSYKEALNKAAKKLTTPEAVKQAMFANADSVAKADAKLQMTPIKKANHKDKANEMKKAKGQQAPKATAAPTKENKKTKKPKGVEIMKDKGVEGSEKVLREAALSELQSYLKKKLSENSMYHEFHTGMEVETPHGTGVIKEINGGTLSVQCEDGKLYDVQMNTVRHFMENAKEDAMKPQEESKVNENRSFDNIEDAKKYAEEESLNGYVQHVQDKGTHFVVDDWYDSDETVASYENGMSLNEELVDEKQEVVKEYGEEEYEARIKVSVRDAAEAIELVRDSYSQYIKNGVIKMSGTDNYFIYDEDIADALLQDFQADQIEIEYESVSNEMDEAADVVTYTDASTGQKKTAGVYPTGKGSTEVSKLKGLGVTSAGVDRAK